MANLAQLPSLHDEITQEYYRTTAARSHVGTPQHYTFTSRQLERRLRGWLPGDPDTRCLDLACGCGDMLYLLERRGVAATAGVDLCQEELDNARLFVQSRLVHEDVLPFLQSEPDKSYDFITAFNFLEHLAKDKLLAVLAEARRVLTPGGTMVCMVPNAVSPFGSTTRHWDLTHEWAFTPNNFRQLASLCGFDSKVEYRECGPIAHGFKSGIRVVAWKAIRAAISAWLLVELADRKGGVYTMDMMVRLRRP
jgi:SAM-dependent methyltransferase